MNESVSRIFLFLAVAALVLAGAIISPSGTVLFAVVAAAVGLILVIVGPGRFRLYGAIPLLLGGLLAVNTYPTHKREYGAYETRQALSGVVTFGGSLGAALDRHVASVKSLPKSVEELGVAIPLNLVARVRIETANLFTVTLALTSVTGKQLVFAAVDTNGMRIWRCMTRDVEIMDLPGNCRDYYKASN